MSACATSCRRQRCTRIVRRKLQRSQPPQQRRKSVKTLTMMVSLILRRLLRMLEQELAQVRTLLSTIVFRCQQS